MQMLEAGIIRAESIELFHKRIQATNLRNDIDQQSNILIARQPVVAILYQYRLHVR